MNSPARKNNIKDKIKLSFNRAYKTYDTYCSTQSKVAHDAINFLLEHHNTFGTVADFACGTGQSTQKLVENIIYNKCYAVDFAENLLAKAKQRLAFIKSNNIKFILSDFDECHFSENYLDLIFCNMGLQWSLDLANTMGKFFIYLKNQSYLVFSIPMENNFPELKKSSKNTMLEHRDIKRFLNNSQFELIDFCHHTYFQEFTSALEALRSIKGSGANSLIQRNGFPSMTLAKSQIKNVFVNPDNITLTYYIGIYIAKKRSY